VIVTGYICQVQAKKIPAAGFAAAGIYQINP